MTFAVSSHVRESDKGEQGGNVCMPRTENMCRNVNGIPRNAAVQERVWCVNKSTEEFRYYDTPCIRKNIDILNLSIGQV